MDTYRLKMQGWEKIFHTNGDQKKAGVAILISDKIDFHYFCYYLKWVYDNEMFTCGDTLACS